MHLNKESSHTRFSPNHFLCLSLAPPTDAKNLDPVQTGSSIDRKYLGAFGIKWFRLRRKQNVVTLNLGTRTPVTWADNDP